MGSDSWPTVELHELAATPISYGVLKPGLNVPNGVLLVRGGDITGHRVLVSQLRRIAPEVSRQHARTVLQGGEILVSLVGTVGQVALAPNSLNGANVYRQIAVIRAKVGVDTRFVRYFLISPHGQASISGHLRGSVHSFINLRDLRMVKVPCPPFAEQQAIACILGVLDDKIELNRRRNRTLEAMARAIFQSWFVDFDPVKAKAAGRTPPGLSSALAALFPDSFTDSPLGPIPKGWRAVTVGDVASVSSGKRPDARSAVESPEASVPLWGGNGPMAFVAESLFAEPILVTGRVGTLGSVFRINTPCWPSDNTLVLLTKSRAGYEYLFLALQRIDFPSLSCGSMPPLLTQTDLKKQNVLLPSEKILTYFSNVAKSLYDRADECNHEGRTLAALRDALLPKLISGELRVPDAARIVGRCT